MPSASQDPWKEPEKQHQHLQNQLAFGITGVGGSAASGVQSVLFEQLLTSRASALSRRLPHAVVVWSRRSVPASGQRSQNPAE
jgi:hypothetical protein